MNKRLRRLQHQEARKIRFQWAVERFGVDRTKPLEDQIEDLMQAMKPPVGTNPPKGDQGKIGVICHTVSQMPDGPRISKKLPKEEKKYNYRQRGVDATLGTHRSSPANFEKAIKDFYSSWEWKRLSYDVKVERGRTCECCGAKAPNVVIHTDHIKPIRHFWHLRLDKTNLQILCQDCNMGKGSRDSTDFRALNAEQDVEPEPPELSEADLRLLAIREQLRLN